MIYFIGLGFLIVQTIFSITIPGVFIIITFIKPHF